jgi:hypothetical protein
VQPYRIKRIATRGEKPPPPGPGVAKIEWDPIDPALEPDHVLLVAKTDSQGPAFRAVWTGDNALKKGNRSTLYGFTSNLSPTYDTVRIQSPGGAGGGIRPAGFAPPAADSGKAIALQIIRQAAFAARAADDGKAITAEGQGPTPKPQEKAKPAAAEPPPRAEGPPPPPPLLATPLPPLSPAAAIPGGSTKTPAAFGSPSASRGGGGGGSVGGGSSSGAGTTQAQQQQQQQQPVSFLQQIQLTVQQQVVQNTTVNQSQQQSQSQAQQQQQPQQQSQSQSQSQSQGNTPAQVIPEPATVIGAVFALIFLIPLSRKRRTGACIHRE